MKFAHMADTHLGRRNFKLKEREQDFIEAFKKAVEAAVERDVDAIVHSGDLFEQYLPGIDVITAAMDILSYAKEHGVKFLAIPGNHDIYQKKTYLSVLDKAGLIINLADPRYIQVQGESVVVKGEKVKECVFYGLPYTRALGNVLRRTLFKEEKGFRVLVLHGLLQEVFSKNYELSLSDLPPRFNYYAMGHWHYYTQISVYGKPLVYPGSLEHFDIAEMIKYANGEIKKGFVIVDTDNSSIEFVEIKPRPVYYIPLHVSPGEDIQRKVLDSVRGKESGSIVIVDLEGRIPGGSRIFIDRNYGEYLRKILGYLWVEIRMEKLIFEERHSKKLVQLAPESLADIEREVLEKKYGKAIADIAKELIDILGRDLSGIELVTAVSHAVEVIKKGLIENDSKEDSLKKY